MSCVLRIEGIAFDVDGFLKSTSLKAYKVWHSGERMAPRRKDHTHYQSNGCNIDISHADFNEFDTQKADAQKFLMINFDQLKRLPEFGLLEKESPSLDFGIYTRMFEVAAQVDRFEPELLRLAGNLNITIELSQYEPASEEE